MMKRQMITVSKTRFDLAELDGKSPEDVASIFLNIHAQHERAMFDEGLRITFTSDSSGGPVYFHIQREETDAEYQQRINRPKETRKSQGFMWVARKPCGKASALAWDDDNASIRRSLTDWADRGDQVERIELFEGQELPEMMCSNRAECDCYSFHSTR
jgi:hypothetical protein